MLMPLSTAPARGARRAKQGLLKMLRSAGTPRDRSCGVLPPLAAPAVRRGRVTEVKHRLQDELLHPRNVLDPEKPPVIDRTRLVALLFSQQ